MDRLGESTFTFATATVIVDHPNKVRDFSKKSDPQDPLNGPRKKPEDIFVAGSQLTFRGPLGFGPCLNI